jgi:hypothetical protein
MLKVPFHWGFKVSIRMHKQVKALHEPGVESAHLTPALSPQRAERETVSNGTGDFHLLVEAS